MPAGYRNDYVGRTKGGATVLRESQVDANCLLIQCACGQRDKKTREAVRQAMSPGRKLQCYDCGCRDRAQAARVAATTRMRGRRGMFAPKPL